MLFSVRLLIITTKENYFLKIYGKKYCLERFKCLYNKI